MPRRARPAANILAAVPRLATQAAATRTQVCNAGDNAACGGGTSVFAFANSKHP